MKALLYFAIFVAPMGARAFCIPIAGVQLSPFRLSILLALVVSFILFLCRSDRKFIIFHKYNLYSVFFFFIWLIYAFVSVLWSIEFSLWLKSVFFIFIGFTSTILFINYFDSLQSVIRACYAFVMGAFVQSIIGWYEVLTRNYHWLEMTDANYRYYIDGTNRVPVAMCGNPNGYATLMFIATLLAFFLFLNGDNKKRFFMSIISVNFAMQLFLTTSRANILALVVAAMVIYVLMGNKKRNITIGVFIIVALPFVCSFLFKKIGFDFTTGSDYFRMNLIKNGYAFLHDTYGFGVGSGQIESWMATRAVYDTGGIASMHNWWAELFTAYGIIVFSMYLVYYVALLVVFGKVAINSNQKDFRNISAIMCAILFGYVVSSVSSSSNISVEWLWVFWAICITSQGMVTDKELNVSFE